MAVKRDMEHRIKDAFDQVHANDKVKEQTKQAVFAALPTAQESAPAKNRKRNTFVQRRLIPVAACLVIAFAAVIGGYQLYFTPTAAISIDINPSLELNVNRFDRVVSVDAYNEDGQRLADSVDVINMNYADAIDALLASSDITTLLDQGELLSVSLACDNKSVANQMYERLQTCTAYCQNAYCTRANSEEVEQAHHQGLSFGKYQAYLDAHACDESLTVEDARHMTMRELHDISSTHGRHYSERAANNQSSANTANSSAQGNQGANSGQGSGYENGRGNHYHHGQHAGN